MNEIKQADAVRDIPGANRALSGAITVTGYVIEQDTVRFPHQGTDYQHLVGVGRFREWEGELPSFYVRAKIDSSNLPLVNKIAEEYKRNSSNTGGKPYLMLDRERQAEVSSRATKYAINAQKELREFVGGDKFKAVQHNLELLIKAFGIDIREE